MNPPSQIEGGLQTPILPAVFLCRKASRQRSRHLMINYRNEPIPLRIATQDKEGNQFAVAPRSERGDLAHVFSSTVHKEQSL